MTFKAFTFGDSEQQCICLYHFPVDVQTLELLIERGYLLGG